MHQASRRSKSELDLNSLITKKVQQMPNNPGVSFSRSAQYCYLNHLMGKAFMEARERSSPQPPRSHTSIAVRKLPPLD
jgi:hypothetical protein